LPFLHGRSRQLGPHLISPLSGPRGLES